MNEKHNTEIIDYTQGVVKCLLYSIPALSQLKGPMEHIAMQITQSTGRITALDLIGPHPAHPAQSVSQLLHKLVSNRGSLYE